MDGEISIASMALAALLILALAIFGAVFLLGGTVDKEIISHCKEQGWHNFGQTRIICSVELKKDVK